MNGANEQLELVDEQGKTLGHFLTTESDRKLACAWANSQVTDEELRLASVESGGRSLAEIWKRIGRE